VKRVANAGHSVQGDAPVELAALISDFAAAETWTPPSSGIACRPFRSTTAPLRSGPWRPQYKEWDAGHLDVAGDLPADLEGVYLRNTENPVREPIKRYHPFDGDGMVHAVAFRDGTASYRNRFVSPTGCWPRTRPARHCGPG